MDSPVFENGYCLTPEGLHFEAKSARGGMPRSFWETYSSFANTDGGIVALGVSEDSGKLKVTGVPDVRGTVQNLWNTLNDKEKVSSNLLRDESVSTVDVDGKQVILIEVPAPSAGTGRCSSTATAATLSGGRATGTTSAPWTRSRR